MNNTVLSRSNLNSRKFSVALPLLYPALCTIRAASINSAIKKGIRRTKSAGFKSNERTYEAPVHEDRRTRQDSFPQKKQYQDPYQAREKFREARTSFEGKGKFSRKVAAKKIGVDLKSLEGAKIRKGKRLIPDPLLSKVPRKSKSARFHDPNDAFGSKSKRFQEKLAAGELRPWQDPVIASEASTPDQNPSAQKEIQLEDETKQWMNRGRGNADAFTQFYSTKVGQLSMQPRRFKQDIRFPGDEGIRLPRLQTKDDFEQSEIGTRETKNNDFKVSSYGSKNNDFKKYSYGSKAHQSSPGASRGFDKNIPLSVPYTTSASEFLYGTSVVLAALCSQRIPGRKFYKLYIYKGESRMAEPRDESQIKQRAQKAGVETIFVNHSWLRILDKMSGGRPHNGYVLEASPLPRLPIQSLGEFQANVEKPGYKVVPDYQSREDAQVNGTFDFYMVRASTRKPFILLLDEIVDPGNLGGIVRSAAFLGVSAIAISVRNSASFTPVVLKASAGAAENITIFSVEKTAAFVADSKLAGWKIYAAVAPTKKPRAHRAISLTTDQLDDPLSKDPCLLMLGSEGYGLRQTLRQHADVEISISGSVGRHELDSLNVSVAAGILCSSFLRNVKSKHATRIAEPADAATSEDAEDKIF